jgi:uncharacterized membrane protein
MSRSTVPAEAAPRALWRRGLLVLLLVLGYPLLIHWVVSSGQGGALGEVLVLAPLALVIFWFLGRSRRGRLVLAAIAAGAIAAGVLWHGSDASPVYLYPVPHVAANLFMLWFFGRTLRAGQEPLITRIARYVHGDLSGDVIAYTRRVTWAWCVFFAGTVLVSVLLFALAPLAAWSLFANILSIPLLVSMYFGESVWRVWRHPDFERASVWSVVRACRRLGDSTLDPSRGR